MEFLADKDVSIRNSANINMTPIKKQNKTKKQVHVALLLL